MLAAMYMIPNITYRQVYDMIKNYMITRPPLDLLQIEWLLLSGLIMLDWGISSKVNGIVRITAHMTATIGIM